MGRNRTNHATLPMREFSTQRRRSRRSMHNLGRPRRRGLAELPRTVEEGSAPEFKGEKRVQPQAVVGAAGGIVVAQLSYDRRVDETAPPERRLREKVLDEGSEILHEPRAHWSTEAGLPPPDDVARQCAFLAPLEDVLPSPALELEVRGNSSREMDELVIEQRNSHFDRGGHSHLVGICEVQAGQECLAVQIQQSAQLVPA